MRDWRGKAPIELAVQEEVREYLGPVGPGNFGVRPSEKGAVSDNRNHTAVDMDERACTGSAIDEHIDQIVDRLERRVVKSTLQDCGRQ